MASSPDTLVDDRSDGPSTTSHGRRKLILLVVPLLLGGVGAGLWFGGFIPKLLGRTDATQGDGPAGQHAVDTHAKPVFVEMPEIIANLNSGTRRSNYVKLKAQLEVSSQADALALQEAMPRVMDMFQTYIREMRPEEMRGSGGTYRLREELIARANLAAAPTRVRDVLFVEVLIQ